MKIEHYQTINGRVPFDDWFAKLDMRNRAAVERRLAAIEDHDHFGDCGSLGGGLHEVRFLGPGLRVYFAILGRTVVLLLGGSDKASQKRAINSARQRLRDFRKRSR